MVVVEKFEKYKNKWLVMLVLLALPIFLTLLPFLLGNRVIANSDILSWVFPFWSFFKTSVASGQSFLWNPNNLSGFPSFVTSTGGFFSPINYLVFRFLPLTVAYNWLVFFYSVLAAFFTSQLLRLFRLSFWPAYLGGLIYIFANWANVFDLPVLQAITFLPLLFTIIWQLKDSWRWVIYGGLITGLAFLSTHYNWLLMSLISGGLFALFVGSLLDKKKISQNHFKIYRHHCHWPGNWRHSINSGFSSSCFIQSRRGFKFSASGRR